MKQYLSALILLLGGYLSATTVTGTIQDVNGNRYANGTVSAFNLITGASMTPSTTDANGFFSITLSPSTYAFTVCAKPVNIGPNGGTSVTQVCAQPATPIVILGGSQDVSTQINAVAPILGPSVAALLGANNAFTGNNTHAGLETFNGQVAINNTVTGAGSAAIAGIFGGSPLMTGAWTITTLNGEVNVAAQVANGTYSDVCAAISGAPSGTALYLPWNTSGYNCAATATLGTYVSLRAPLSNHATVINCPAGTVCMSVSGTNNVSGVTLNCNATTTDCWQIKGSENTVTDSYAANGGNSTILWHIKQFNGTTLSGNIHLTRIRAFNYTGTAMYVEHVTDIYGIDISAYATLTNTTAKGLIVDTGTSGFQCVNCIFNQNALGGIIIEHTQPGAGAFGLFPDYMFWTSVISDAAGAITTSDAILFDSTLTTNAVYAVCVNCWAVGHGSNGIHISGGQGIRFVAPRIRSNTLSGILIDSANVQHVEFNGAEVAGNNTSNTANLSGLDITAGAQNVSLVGGEYCNCLDPFGHQKFGWRVTAVNASGFIADGVNTQFGNETKYFSNANTGAFSISGGSSDPADTTTAWWDNGAFHVHGQLFGDAAWFNTGGIFPGTAGGSTLGNNSDPWSDLYLGSAATNNIRLTGTATAARIATFPDATGIVPTDPSSTYVPATNTISGTWVCTSVTPVTVNTSTTADQNMMACTVPAGVLNRVNRSLRISTAGIYSTPAASTAQMTAKVKLCTVSGCGSGTVLTLINIQSTALGTVQITNDNWGLNALSTVQTAGASSAHEVHGDFLIDLATLTTAADSAFGDTNTATVGTIDSTAQLFIQVTFAFSTASGSNTATERQLLVETVN